MRIVGPPALTGLRHQGGGLAGLRHAGAGSLDLAHAGAARPGVDRTVRKSGGGASGRGSIRRRTRTATTRHALDQYSTELEGNAGAQLGADAAATSRSGAGFMTSEQMVVNAAAVAIRLAVSGGGMKNTEAVRAAVQPFPFPGGARDATLAGAGLSNCDLAERVDLSMSTTEGQDTPFARESRSTSRPR